MSEEGLNKGQGQDQETKTPFFDSSEISKKENVEHFTNVAGAEERAKAAERAKKAAEAEAREVHEADVRAASEQMKKAENGEKKGIIHFLFGGWHKFIVIALVVLAGLGMFFYVAQKRGAEDQLSGQEFFEKASEEFRASDRDKAVYVELADEFEKRIENAKSNDEAYQLSFYYAKFVYLYSISVNDAKEAFREISPKSEMTNGEACSLKSLYLDIYNVETIDENAPLKEQMEKCDVEEE